MNNWDIAAISYGAVAVLTFLPVLIPMIRGVKLNPGGTIGTDGTQKWLIVAVSSHVALALSFHRGLRVPDLLRAYRLGESEFYDTYRRLLDRPLTFGKTEEEQLDAYFAAVADVRKLVRSAEADSMPSIDQTADTPAPK